MKEQADATVAGEPVSVRLRAAMRRLPGPVALVTTCDPDTGAPAGLAASAVIPVAMDPPSMLASINRNASAHDVIARSGRFCINLCGPGLSSLVAAFSDSARRDERFSAAEWAVAGGLPYRTDACASLFCVVRHELAFGTHTLFVGEVLDVRLGDDPEPLAWAEGAFAGQRRMPEPGQAVA